MTKPIDTGGNPGHLGFMVDTPQKLDAASHAWLRDDSLRRILLAIKQAGGEARIVGGAVRDALLGREVKEIDLAVNLPPHDVSTILKAAGIKVVPTGIDHGTITAVVDHRGFEITTLRRDVETDGRHAKVTFTDDWQADAARRDFTINALYVDAGGNLYDYFCGRADLTIGHVRFIGDAETRIREDVLRILRFFRFSAWFGRGEADAEGLDACSKLAELIPQLSVERIWHEIVKLLAADDPALSWQRMSDCGVLIQFLQEGENVPRLRSLLAVEKKYAARAHPLVRLTALLPQDETVAATVAQRLKVSKREAARMIALASMPRRLNGKLDPVPFRRALYEYGIDNARDGLLLLAAEHPALDIESALASAATWDKPVFPLQGADLLKLGMPSGPEMGTTLRALEDWWIAEDFRPDRAECLAKAQKKLL